MGRERERERGQRIYKEMNSFILSLQVNKYDFKGITLFKNNTVPKFYKPV